MLLGLGLPDHYDRIQCENDADCTRNRRTRNPGRSFGGNDFGHLSTRIRHEFDTNSTLSCRKKSFLLFPCQGAVRACAQAGIGIRARARGAAIGRGSEPVPAKIPTLSETQPVLQGTVCPCRRCGQSRVQGLVRGTWRTLSSRQPLQLLLQGTVCP